MAKEEHAKVLPPLPRNVYQSGYAPLYDGFQMHQYAIAALDAAHRKSEPISDAEIYKLWPTTTNFTFKDELLKFSRRLIERVT